MPLLGADSIVRENEAGAPIFAPVSFALEAGDRLALQGPSGIGKTLLLRSLTLLDPADRGQALFAGESILDEAVPAFRRRVQLVAQAAPMVAGTVRDNLSLPFQLKQADEAHFDEPRALALLSRFELSDSISRPSDELSGGERQVVALIRALLVEPDVLLLDEPTSAMDPTRTAVAEELVDQWHAESPRASIWVSHDAAQLARVTTRSFEMARDHQEEEE